MTTISIYGAGHMAESLLKGLSRHSRQKIKIYNRTQINIARLINIYPRLQIVSQPAALASRKIFLFCMIPATAIVEIDRDLIAQIHASGSVLVSCANGISITGMKTIFPKIKIVRLLPNIHWQMDRGVTLWKGNQNVSKTEKSELLALLKPITQMFQVKNESDFDRIGALTACSPGLLAEIMQQFYKEFQIASPLERKMVKHSWSASIDYLLHSQKKPEQIIKEVAKRGGLTEVGIEALQETLPNTLQLLRNRMEEKIRKRNTMITQQIVRIHQPAVLTEKKKLRNKI